MAIERIVRPYELLVRLNDGVISGAHKRSLESIVDTSTGEIFSAKELDAQPVELTQADKDYLRGLINDEQIPEV